MRAKTKSKPDYFVAFPFSYPSKRADGKRIRISTGEDVPSEVIDDETILESLLHSGKVLIRKPNGEVQYDAKNYKLTDGQIEALIREQDLGAIKQLLQSKVVSRESLVRLQLAAEKAHLPKELIDFIERVSLA